MNWTTLLAAAVFATIVFWQDIKKALGIKKDE